MGLESLPSVVFLLLPGFLSWGIFCWGTVTRKISQVQHLFISLLLSILAFSIAYLVTNLFKLLAINTFAPSWDIRIFPGYIRILSNPEMLSLELLIAMYVLAVLLGFLLIRLYKKEGIARLFSRMGLDLYGHEDTWYRLFHKNADYVTVYLKDGNIVSGWPTYYSQSGNKETSELYLSKMHYYQKEKERWVSPSRSVEGLLINTDSISHIEFKKPETGNREDISPVEGSGLSKMLSRTDFLRMGILLFYFGLLLFRIQNRGSVSAISGFSFVILSLLIFMPAIISSKIGARINISIGGIKNIRVRNLPILVEWCLVVGIFAVAFADGLVSLIQLKQASVYFYIVYGIGILWFVALLIEFSSRLRPKQSA